MRACFTKTGGLLVSLIWGAAIFVGYAIAELPKPAEPPYKHDLKNLHPVPIKWETFAEGFDRTALNFEGEIPAPKGSAAKKLKRRVELVVFRVDTNKYTLRIVTAKSVVGKNVASLKSVHEKTGALLTVNGGFFSDAGDPIGLVVSNGKQVNGYDEEGGTGVLAVYRGVPKIGFAGKFTTDPMPDYALQNGPLLVDPGGKFGINVIAAHYFYRTIIALDKKGRLLNMGKHQDEVYIGINVPNFVSIMPEKQEKPGT